MGLMDFLRSYGSDVEPTRMRSHSEAVSAVAEAIYAEIESRIATFTMSDALQMPPVVRAVGLITSIGASMLPLSYRDGQALPIQPRIVRRPDPFATRYEHMAQTLYGLITDGCAYWRLGDIDPDTNRPRFARVIPHEKVQIEQGSFAPVYRVDNQPLVYGRDILHITIGRRPGELHGRGPLREGLRYFGAVKAAEDYAREWFAGGGVPPIILKAVGTVSPTDLELSTAKQAWVDARTNPALPAVFGKAWDVMIPQVNPQTGQMQESRSYGATVAATLLGIPGALLHVQTSGATITYTNPAGAIEDLVKSTIVPTYLSAIEAAWSDLVAGTQTVRFDLRDMDRADMAARVAIYKDLAGIGAISAEEIRAAEGWGPGATDTAHTFDPTPAVEEAVNA